MTHQPSATAHSPGSDRGQSRALLVGDRGLYLEALAEFLATEAGASTYRLTLDLTSEEALPGEIDLVVVDVPSDPVLADHVVARLKGTYPHARFMSISTTAAPDEGTARSSDRFERIGSHRSLVSLTRELGLGDTAPSSREVADTAEPARHPLWMLTERERSVLRLIVGGQPPEQIAETLAISRHTVRTHLQNSMAKLGVNSRTQLVTTAIRAGVRMGPPDRLS